MKAWRVIWLRMPDAPCIIVAPTRGVAVARALGALTDAGYKGRWQDVKATRAPFYDLWAARQVERRHSLALSEDTVRGEL